MEKQKRKYEKCFKCQKQINKEVDHYVQISTFNRKNPVNNKPLPDDHLYFHINCWANYFNELVTKKAMEKLQMAQSKAMGMLAPMMQMLKGFNGLMPFGESDAPLSSLVISKSRIKQKIENDRKEKREKKRSRKAQLH